MGGNPRKGDVVRRPAGHRQDLHGQGDGAREGGGPVPVRVVDRVPVACTTAQTGRKIRNYFKELRKAARGRGWRDRVHRGDRRDRGCPQRHAQHVPYADANGFYGSQDPNGRTIERNTSEGISGVVNELLIQMQSFDTHPPVPDTNCTSLPGSTVSRTGWLPAAPPHPEEAAEARSRTCLLIACDEPRFRSRPRAASSRSVRPFDPLRPPELGRVGATSSTTTSIKQGARTRARQGGAARRARGDDLRVHAGDDRAPVRRSARVGAA